MLRALLSARFHLAGSPSLTWITTLLRCAAGCACACSPLPARRKIAATAASPLHQIFPIMKPPLPARRDSAPADAGALCAFRVKSRLASARALSRVRSSLEFGPFQRLSLSRGEATRAHPAFRDLVDRRGKRLFLGGRCNGQAS